MKLLLSLSVIVALIIYITGFSNMIFASIDLTKLTGNEQVAINSTLIPSTRLGSGYYELNNPIIQINNQTLNYENANESSDNFFLNSNDMGFALTIKVPISSTESKIVRIGSGNQIDTIQNLNNGETTYWSAASYGDNINIDSGKYIDYNNILMITGINPNTNQGHFLATTLN